jgi:arylsulfate sulfotransferase
VFKVDRANRLKWILAPHKGWGPAGPSGAGPDTSQYLLTAVDANRRAYDSSVQLGEASVADSESFDWPWGQHAVMKTEKGTFLLFDNGDTRHFASTELFSRAVEYRVDPVAMTVQQVWQYGRNREDDFYSSIVSDVDVLPHTGHVMVSPGNIRKSANGPHAYVTELTYPQGTVVFEARLAFKDAYPSQPDLNYRAERMDLYP